MKELFIREIKVEKPEETSEYPFSLPAVKHLDNLVLNSRVTFLAGENGMGKSTLIEAMAVNYGFNPEGGSKNFNFSTAKTHSDLYRYLTLVKGAESPKDGYFLRAESFYNVMTEIQDLGADDSYGSRALHEQSHGESFMSLVVERFWGKGLYILDEPEAALSPIRQMALLTCIDDLVKQDSQFIIATHSPILLSYPKAEILVLKEEGIKTTPYQQTEHYLITKQFLNNPEMMLEHLLD